MVTDPPVSLYVAVCVVGSAEASVVDVVEEVVVTWVVVVVVEDVVGDDDPAPVGGVVDVVATGVAEDAPDCNSMTDPPPPMSMSPTNDVDVVSPTPRIDGSTRIVKRVDVVEVAEGISVFDPSPSARTRGGITVLGCPAP